MAMTATERKKKERRLAREQGLTRCDVYAKPEHHKAIRAYAKKKAKAAT
jgi:hypothetical protein